MTRQQLNGLRGRFLPIYRKAMADSGGDLWGHSPLDLACDNLHGVNFRDLQTLIQDLGLVPYDDASRRHPLTSDQRDGGTRFEARQNVGIDY